MNENLKPFTSENQPANRGRKKGVPNRATILKKWLKVKIDADNPVTGEMGQKLTVEDTVILALIEKAKAGDVPAVREVLDSMYGKLTETQNLNVNLQDLSDEELISIIEN